MNATPHFAVWRQLLCLLSVEVALIVVVAAILQRWTQSAVWRRTLWQVCLLSVLGLAAFELTGAARALAAWLQDRALPQARRAERTGGRIAPPGLSDEFRKRVADRIARKEPIENVEPVPGVPDFSQSPARLAVATFAFPVAHGAGTPNRPAVPTEDTVADSMAVLYLAVVWLTGAGLVVARGCLAGFLLLVFRRCCPRLTDAALRARVAALGRALGVRRPIQLVASARLAGPMVFGVLRPVVVMPSDLAERFTVVEQEAMLAHELAHLAGRDPAWYLLANWASAILWWHPLVWWARRQLHRASELAADEASLMVADGPGALAESLVKIGARLAGQRSFVWMGVAGNGLRSGLGRRVERLIHLCGSSRKPPGRARTVMAKLFGPAALVVAVTLCTAWIGPLAFTKGESMNTIKQTWSHSLAAFALLTSTPGATQAELGVNTKGDGAKSDVAALVRDGRLLYEMGKLDDAESKLKEASRRDPGNALPYYFLTLVHEQRYAQARKDPETTQTAPAPSAERPSDPTGNPAAKKPARSAEAEKYQRMMMERYGIIPKGAPLPAFKASNKKERSPIESRLEKIVLDEVMFDGVPLAEVLRWLNEESRTHDPEKQGINFLINPNAPVAPALQTVDPTTGQPVLLPPPEPPDMNGVIVRFNLPLRDMRLKDVLDAMVKVADKPIEYSVEDYGVVFSAAPNASAGGPNAPASRFLDSQPLIVRTFKVETNTFLAGLKRAFGTEFDPKERGAPEEIRSALRDVFVRLGINMEVPGKTVFYNDLTGIVMVRATYEDLEIVKAAIETLGGSAADQTGAQNSGKERAGLLNDREEMMRRYGMGRYGVMPPKP